MKKLIIQLVCLLAIAIACDNDKQVLPIKDKTNECKCSMDELVSMQIIKNSTILGEKFSDGIEGAIGVKIRDTD